jgi:quinol monooxygenase YgiN
MTTKIAFVALLVLFNSGHALRSQSSGQARRVRVVGLIKVKPGREADFEALVTRMASRTKREDRGNIRYEFFRTSAPVAQSLRSDHPPVDYVFEEEWVNQESVDAHLKWALPVLETEWKSLTEKTDFLRLVPIE